MKHNINKPINIKEIELIILELSKNKSLGPDDFIDKFYQILKELTQFHTITSRKCKRKEHFPFYETSIILIPNQIRTDHYPSRINTQKSF